MTPQLRTNGHCGTTGLNKRTQSPGRCLSGDRDKTGKRGSKTRRVDCWRPRTSTLATTGEEVTRGVLRDAEVSKVVENIGSEVNSRNLHPVDVVGPDSLSISVG